VSRPTFDLHRNQRVIGAAGGQLARKGRAQDGELVAQGGGVVVLDDLEAVLHDADQLQSDRQVGLVGRVPGEVRRCGLCICEEPHSQGGTDVQPLLGRTARRHYELVVTRCVRHAALKHDHSVDGYELPVGAPLHRGRRFTRRGVAFDGLEDLKVAVEADHLFRAFYIAELGDGGVEARRVPGPSDGCKLGEKLFLGGVSAGQVDGVGGLRAPGCCHRPHGHAAEQTGQDDEGQIASPSVVQRAARPVGRHPQSVVGHLHLPVQASLLRLVGPSAP
jgi:hypothetical protein